MGEWLAKLSDIKGIYCLPNKLIILQHYWSPMYLLARYIVSMIHTYTVLAYTPYSLQAIRSAAEGCLHPLQHQKIAMYFHLLAAEYLLLNQSSLLQKYANMLEDTVCPFSCQYSPFLCLHNQLGKGKSSVYPIHCLSPVSDHSTYLEASLWKHHQVGPAKQTAQGQQQCECGKKDRPAIFPCPHNTTPNLHIAQCNHS